MNYDPQVVTTALKKLFRTYPQFAADDLAETMRVYFEALQPYATQDISTAVSNFLAGAAPGHNPAYAPSAPLVGAETRRVMNLRLESEARNRAKAPSLPAPQMEHSPESRFRVAAMTAELVKRTADSLSTLDNDTQRKRVWGSVHERFYPADIDPGETRHRLGLPPQVTAGDPDGDGEIA
jgi:hypothetical protein